MGKAKQTNKAADRTEQRDINADDGRSADLRDSPMMAHLMDALEEGTDIGHYGRLVFAMVARHFLDEEEMVRLLGNQPDHNADDDPQRGRVPPGPNHSSQTCRSVQ